MWGLHLHREPTLPLQQYLIQHLLLCMSAIHFFRICIYTVYINLTLWELSWRNSDSSMKYSKHKVQLLCQDCQLQRTYSSVKGAHYHMTKVQNFDQFHLMEEAIRNRQMLCKIMCTLNLKYFVRRTCFHSQTWTSVCSVSNCTSCLFWGNWKLSIVML